MEPLAAYWDPYYVTHESFQSFVILATDSPLHRLRRSFPRRGTQFIFDLYIYRRKCSSPSASLRSAAPRDEFIFKPIFDLYDRTAPHRFAEPPELRGAWRGLLTSDRVNWHENVSSVSPVIDLER